VTQNRELGTAAGTAGQDLDTGIPQSARVYDFLLGGKDNYEVDRAVAMALVQQAPTLPLMVRAQRDLLGRLVTYLVRDAGVRQFLDIGTGLPSANNVHEVAQAIAADSRVQYVDNDPMVLAYARALMRSPRGGRTAFIQADLRDPDSILDHPSLTSTLDRNRPVALLLIGIVHHLRDDDRPYEVVGRLVDWLPSGSYVAVVTPSADFDPAVMASVAATAERAGIAYVPRSRAETEQFLAGLEPVESGVVPILAWRPERPPADVNAVHGWAGVARKP
jgi:hypothetical protein